MHIRSLRRHLRRWAEAHGDEIKVDVNDAGQVIGGNLPDPELLGRSGIWIGEAVYNLRSSLDYLVYNIACYCNGLRHVPQTQFLICDEPDEFWDQVPRRLAHVPRDVVDRFAELQPWSSPPCEWTTKLRDLSNPDKHRAMANLRSVVRVVAGDHPDIAELVPGIEPKPDETYVTMQVFFADTGDDVEDTLVLLQREVLDLIKEFKPAFQT